MNPYSGVNFWEFFPLFFHRLFLLLSGQAEVATDEIQVGVLVCIALSGALVGTLLILRKMTMLANSLSHTILLGIVISFLLAGTQLTLSTLLLASLVTALLTTLSTDFLSKKLRLQEDASIGLIFTSFFALGIVLISLSARSAHIGIEAIMGNADALTPADFKLAGALFLLNAGLITTFFLPYKIGTFDPTFARSIGITTGLFSALLMFQTAMTAIGSFRAVGAFLFLSLLVGPTLIARLFTRRLRSLLILSSGIGALIALFAVALSRSILTTSGLPLSTSGLLSVSIALLFLLALLAKKVRFRYTV